MSLGRLVALVAVAAVLLDDDELAPPPLPMPAPEPGPSPGPSPVLPGDDIEDEEVSGVSESFFKPVAVGQPEDPAIAAQLDELDAYLASKGVRSDLFSARELTTMPKAPGRPVAIPPRTYWEKMARTLVDAVQPIRIALGVPFHVRAYRPPDYNEAVGGSEGSRHQDFSGLDIRLGPDATPAERQALATRFGNLWNDDGRRLRMGFGVYNHPGHVHVHVDTGYRRRKWNDAKHYV